MESKINLDEQNLKRKLHTVIFGHETPAGRLFDLLLLAAILISVVVLMLETVESVSVDYGEELRIIEILFTAVFSIEYLTRIYCSPNRLKYIFSFFGFIDFISIAPTYFSFVYDGSRFLSIFRTVRLLRVFRILKLARFLGEAEQLSQALKDSQYKICVFLGAVFSLALIVGTIMFVVEGPENGFANIPVSVYWAVITLTTVGYGDIVPRTPLGQFIATIVMTLGYGIIAVPTGIVSAQLTKSALIENDKKNSKK